MVPSRSAPDGARNLLAFATCTLIWGSTFLFIRIGNESMPPLWAGALRLALAFVLLVAGALPGGFYVVAAVFGAAFVGEAVYGWVVVGRIEQPLDDEEDDEL